MEKLDLALAKSRLKTRSVDANKSTQGHALLLAGSLGRMGAATIAGRACMRSGVGLLTVCVPKSERFAIHQSLPEALLHFREDRTWALEKYTGIGIGPAFGTDEEAMQLFQNIVQNTHQPMVIDADAITLLAQHPAFWEILPPLSIFTPHQGEFDRLFGPHERQELRLETARKMAEKWNCIFVMKGPKTVIVSSDQQFQNQNGNAGLAKGGSGDALTGMITSFLAQAYDPMDAALLAVFLHGAAADLTCQNQSMESMLVSDVIEHLGKAFELLHN